MDTTTLTEREDIHKPEPSIDPVPSDSNSNHDIETESIKSKGANSDASIDNGSSSPTPDNQQHTETTPRPRDDLVDSDGDSDVILTSAANRSKLRKTLIHSDDDSDGLPSIHLNNNDGHGEDVESETSSSKKVKQSNTERVVHKSTWSDSESEFSDSKSRKSSKAPSKTGNTSPPVGDNEQKPWKDLLDSDSDDALPSIRNVAEPNKGVRMESDSESSDCLPSIHGDYGIDTGSSKKKSEEKPAKKKHLTQKQRQELVKETLSKTQQLIREKSVSLPYEKPKAMSLKEFLAKRAQAKAEFYNPELKKLRPPTPPPLDLTKLESPSLSSKKVEGWVSDLCETEQLPPEEDPVDDLAVDDAFEKLDGCLMEDLTIVDEENKDETQLESRIAMDGDDDEGSICIPLVDLEASDKKQEETTTETSPAAHRNLSPAPVELPAIASTSDTKTFPADDVAVPTPMDVEVELIHDFDSAQLTSEPTVPITSEDNANITMSETVQVLQNDEVAVAEVKKVQDDDFRMKEAALEEYLEAHKPKPPRRTIKDLLKTNPEYAKIANIKPSLHPAGKGFIDFSSPKPRRNHRKELDGLETLKNRFLRHTAVKEKPTEQHFTVTVTTKEEDSQGNQKSTVDNVDYVQHLDNADEDPTNNIISPARLTPGHKFSSFREKLQAQIRSKKLREYEEKMKQHSIYENEKTLDEKEALDEAEEVLEDDDFTTESEPEVTDEEAEAAAEARRKKKKKLKSAFVDEEAEVSDSDQSLGEEGDEYEGDESGEDDGQGSGGEEGESDMDTDHESKDSAKATKSFRRLKPIIDSSDEEDEIELVTLDDGPSVVTLEDDPPVGTLDVGPTVVTLDGDGPLEPRVDQQPSSEDLIVPKEDPDSTGAFGEDGQQFLSHTDLLAIEMSQPVESPSQPQITPAQREIVKLIHEPILPSPSQSIPIAPPSMSQFDELVSSDPWDFDLSTKKSRIPLGRFDSEAALDSFRQEMPSSPSSQPLNNEIAKLVGNAQQLETFSPNLASLCSGVFPSQNPFTPEESQCLAFHSPTTQKSETHPAGQSGGIDQITPRVEREKLTKTRLLFVELNKETANVKMTNDDEDQEPVGRIIKRKKRRLQFSDDEDDEDDEEVEEELDVDAEREYDSEENEIVEPKKPINKGLVSKHGKIRHEFVENEAEFSGSEEGSGDEDERGLDQMDEEEGDDEEIDEEALRDQIGQQHMRNLMDDDARQVRRLQDVLLEDGDLHGDGNLREKQFKWKHIDNLDFDAGPIDEDGVAAQAEDEADRIWKEQKAEKARWMKENSQLTQEEEENSEEEDSQKLFLEKSKYFKLGKSTLKKIQSSCSFMDYSSSNGGNTLEHTSIEAEMTLEITKSSISRRPGIHSQAILASPDDPILKVKRGSFLKRDPACLSKIAEMTKGAESTNSIKVNSRNFVFSVITPPGPEEGTKGKRKNLARHPSNRNETQPRKMARMDRSFDNLDAARKAASIFSQY